MFRFKKCSVSDLLNFSERGKMFRRSPFHQKHLISVGACCMWWEKSESESERGGSGSGREVEKGSER